MTIYITLSMSDGNRPESSGPEQPVPGVAQPGEDVALGIEPPIERGGVDGDVGGGGEHRPHPFGGGDETEKADTLRPRLLQGAHRVHRRAAGGEHGIEDDEVPGVLARGNLEVVVD